MEKKKLPPQDFKDDYLKKEDKKKKEERRWKKEEVGKETRNISKNNIEEEQIAIG